MALRSFPKICGYVGFYISRCTPTEVCCSLMRVRPPRDVYDGYHDALILVRQRGKGLAHITHHVSIVKPPPSCCATPKKILEATIYAL